MTKGEKVASGDRIGKTIIFAKNSLHAEFIQERFDINYPQYKGDLARVITYDTEYAQDLIDKFSEKEKSPHIAISVDMLDTGIDVPEVVNLVFFKVVRSKTKFWQMVGIGTRLCKDLYYQGEDKKFFYIFLRKNKIRKTKIMKNLARLDSGHRWDVWVPPILHRREKITYFVYVFIYT